MVNNTRVSILRLHILSATFIVALVGLMASTYILQPLQWKSSSLIVFGLSIQLFGTILLATDSLRPAWFRNFRDYFLEFVSGRIALTLIDTRDWLNIGKLRRSLRLPDGFWKITKLMLLAALAALLVGLITLCAFKGIPFLTALVIALKRTFLLVLVVYFFILLFSWKFLQQTIGILLSPLLLPLYYVIFVPFILLIMTMLFGPFAIGEILNKKIKPYKDKPGTMMGITYIVVGGVIQLLVVIVPTISPGGFLYDQGLGRPIIAGDAWYEVYYGSMSHDEKTYYIEWRDLLKNASGAMTGVVMVVPADEEQHIQEARDASLALDRVCTDLSSLEPPPVFHTLHDSSLNDLPRLATTIDEFINGLGHTDAIRQTLWQIGKDLENEIERSFWIISSR